MQLHALAGKVHQRPKPAGSNSLQLHNSEIRSAHWRVTVVTRCRHSPLSCRYLVTNWRKNCWDAGTSGPPPRPPATISKNAATVDLESSAARAQQELLTKEITRMSGTGDGSGNVIRW